MAEPKRRNLIPTRGNSCGAQSDDWESARARVPTALSRNGRAPADHYTVDGREFWHAFCIGVAGPAFRALTAAASMELLGLPFATFGVVTYLAVRDQRSLVSHKEQSMRMTECLLTVGRVIALAAALVAPAAVCAESDGNHLADLHYVPPITGAIYNETPYITTELRPFYMYNAIPSGFFGGGHINLGALQIRAAITERLGFIATKDGYADLDFASRSPLKDDSGFANIAAGLKYALLADAPNDRFFTVGLRYEAPSGDLDTLGIKMQGGGDGFFNPFVTGAVLLFDKVGLEASFGLNQAVDTDHDSSSVHASVHADYEVLRNLYVVSEFNTISTVDDGDRVDGSAFGSFEGFDLVNFGNSKSGTVMTYGVGARFRVTRNFLLGAAYELPVGGREDIIDYRVTIDAIVHL
jgi:hypothetical protein